MRVSTILTANDVGATGSNQVGVAVKKSGPLIEFFPPLDKAAENPDVILHAHDAHSGERLEVRYVYYNNKIRGGTRNEYRLSRISSFLTRNKAIEGDVLVISKADDGSFLFAIERLLDPSSGLGSIDYISTNLDDGWTIGLRSTELEMDVETNAIEGQEQLVLSRRYERSSINRRMAIEMHGRTCIVCQFSFSSSYGSIAGDYVEIHHLVPVSFLDGPTPVSPKEDLVPLCSNCHRMAHRRWPPYSPEELREALHSSAPRIVTRNTEK
jgi:predicted HNH restriction endonuclease